MECWRQGGRKGAEGPVEEAFAEPQKLKLGIFGLTKVGKSTLFNSIVGFPVSSEDVNICTGTTLKATRDVTAPNSSYVVHFLRKSGEGGMEDLIQGIRDEIGDVQQDLDGDGALEEMTGFQRNKAGATQESRRVALGKMERQLQECVKVAGWAEGEAECTNNVSRSDLPEFTDVRSG